MKMKKIIITLTVVIMTIAAFGQTDSTVICRIWKTKSFCDLPEKINVPGAVNYSNTFVKGVSCQELDKQGNLVGVWVTFEGINKSELYMTSFYNNISLIRINSADTIHPIAYMERHRPIQEKGDPEYSSNKSTFGKCTFELKPKKKYDIFIIFSAADIGDKLIIDKFFETEIKQ
jgi:hypothetical protein